MTSASLYLRGLASLPRLNGVAAARPMPHPRPKLIRLTPALPTAKQEGAAGWVRPSGITCSSTMGKQAFVVLWLQTSPACRGNQLLHQQMASNHQGWQRGSGGTSRVISNPLERETYRCPSQPVSIRRDPGYADMTSRGAGTFTNVTPGGLLGHPGEGHTSAPLHRRGN